ncbi:MAG: zinc ribbon domain-containing protein [Schwartzia sp.]|nr:zinc ribbon domain-containing protein [Schwartzia sp. (in: firmicutes)]
MNCKNCGRELTAGSRFCLYCGAQVQEEKERKASKGKLALIIGIICTILLVIGIAGIIISGRIADARAMQDGAYGHGSTSYKGMTVSYQQTAKNSIKLSFNNSGSFDFKPSGAEITVVAQDEHGNQQTAVISKFFGFIKIRAYDGTLTKSGLRFDKLEGKIMSVKIVNLRYDNTNKEFDFGKIDRPIVVRDMGTKE